MPLHFVYRVYFVSLSRHCAKHRVACQLTFTSISLLDDSPQLEKIEWTWHEILRKTQSELMFNSMDSATNCTRFKPLLESQYYCLAHLAPSTQEFKYQQTDTLGSHPSEVKILPVAPCHQNWDGLWRFGPFSRVLACEVRWEDGRMGGINNEWTFNQ